MIRRALLATLLALAAAGNAWSQTTTTVYAEIALADVDAENPSLAVRGDSLSTIRSRIGLDTGSYRADWVSLRNRVLGYPGDWRSLLTTGGAGSTWSTIDGGGGTHYTQAAWANMAERLLETAVVWSLATGTTEQTTADAMRARLIAYFDGARDDAVSFGWETLSLTGYGYNDGAESYTLCLLGNGEEYASEGGRWAAFVFALDLFQEELRAADADLADDLYEIVASFHRSMFVKFGQSGCSSNGPYRHGYGYAQFQYAMLVSELFLAHEIEHIAGRALWSGFTLTEASFETMIEAHWPWIEQQFHWDEVTQAGGTDNGYYWDPVRDRLYSLLAAHNAVPSRSPLVNYPRLAELGKWIVMTTGRNWTRYRSTGELGGTAQPIAHQTPQWVFSSARAFAQLVDDSQALHHLDAYDDDQGSGAYAHRWGWLNVLYEDPTRARDATPYSAGYHFGTVNETAWLTDNGGGQWTVGRADGDAAWDHYERGAGPTNTRVVVIHGGDIGLTGNAGHYFATPGHIEYWLDGVAVLSASGTQDDRGLTWNEHKYALRNVLQIDVQEVGDPGYAYGDNSVDGGGAPQTPDDLSFSRFRFSKVTRFGSLSNGFYERRDNSGAYPNRVIGSFSGGDADNQTDTYRETVVFGPFLAVLDRTHPLHANALVSQNWRVAGIDSLWTIDGTIDNPSAINAAGGMESARSTDATRAQMVRRSSFGKIRTRVHVPWASDAVTWLLSQGPASDGTKWAGYTSSNCGGTAADDGSYSNEFHVHGSDAGAGGHQWRPCDDVLDQDEWEWGIDEDLDYGGYMGPGTLRTSVGGESDPSTEDADLAILTLMQIDYATEEFAAVTAITAGDSLVAAKAYRAADSTLVVVFAEDDTQRTEGGWIDVAAMHDDGAVVVWTGLVAQNYTIWHDTDSLGVVVADSTGLVEFRLDDYGDGDNVFALTEGGTPPDPPSDTTPPPAPSGLTVTPLSSSSMRIAFDVVDDSGTGGSNPCVTRIYRDGVEVPGSPVATSLGQFDDAGLAAATTYGYTIRHEDAEGNQTALSAEVEGTTTGAPDATPPIAITVLEVIPISTSEYAIWWAPTSDGTTAGETSSGLDRYEVWIDGALYTSVDVPGVTAVCASGYAAASSHCVVIRTYDGVGLMTPSAQVCAQTLGSGSDNVGPAAPAVITDRPNSTTIRFVWTTPCQADGVCPDPSGIAGYTLHELTTDTYYTLAASTHEYLFPSLTAGTVRAVEIRATADGAGNEGLWSDPVANQIPLDTTPPIPIAEVFVTPLNPSATRVATWVYETTDPEPSSLPIHYRFELQNAAGVPIGTQDWSSVVNGRVTVVWPDLTPESTYRVRAHAYDDAGQGLSIPTWSPVKVFATGALPANEVPGFRFLKPIYLGRKEYE